MVIFFTLYCMQKQLTVELEAYMIALGVERVIVNSCSVNLRIIVDPTLGEGISYFHHMAEPL